MRRERCRDTFSIKVNNVVGYFLEYSNPFPAHDKNRFGNRIKGYSDVSGRAMDLRSRFFCFFRSIDNLFGRGFCTPCAPEAILTIGEDFFIFPDPIDAPHNSAYLPRGFK